MSKPLVEFKLCLKYIYLKRFCGKSARSNDETGVKVKVKASARGTKADGMRRILVAMETCCQPSVFFHLLN